MRFERAKRTVKGERSVLKASTRLGFDNDSIVACYIFEEVCEEEYDNSVGL